MATIINRIIFSVLLITTTLASAHTIFAPNDIPLLDNRFRIDPFTEQVTFILNHSKGAQVIVLVRPDGSKIYYKEHPDTVSWVTTSKVDIITVEKPMTGPWQAIAKLNGDNRIKLVSNVELQTNKLPLKLFDQEYITTHASLYYDGKIMNEKAYLNGAKLSVALIGEHEKKVALYKDNGEHYDALPFDGELTARMYVDLAPGRYLLSIRTKNNIFTRSQNQDAVVFPFPLSYEVTPIEYGSKEALFTFKIDGDELDPASVMIDATIKNIDNEVIGNLIAHSAGNISDNNIFSQISEVGHGTFSLTGKVFATTISGREIELQLPKQEFSLSTKGIMPTIEISDDFVITDDELNASTPIWKNIWVLASITIVGLILIIAIIFIILRRRKKNKLSNNEEQLPKGE